MAKKKTTQTSRMAHAHNKQSGLYSTQDAQALAILSSSAVALTSREIYQQMNKIKPLDISSARRTLNTLQNQGLISVSGTRKCNVTGMTVQTYLKVAQRRSEAA